MGKFIRNWFSNFLPFDKPLSYNGIEYITPEHFYQAMKTIHYNERIIIASVKTPDLAKKAGRQINLRPHWELIKYAAMRYAQVYRFRKETFMRLKLMKTKNEIVEWNNWCDRIWGKCVCNKCNNEGDNFLGKILMEIRDSTIEPESSWPIIDKQSSQKLI